MGNVDLLALTAISIASPALSWRGRWSRAEVRAYGAGFYTAHRRGAGA